MSDSASGDSSPSSSFSESEEAESEEQIYKSSRAHESKEWACFNIDEDANKKFKLPKDMNKHIFLFFKLVYVYACSFVKDKKYVVIRSTCIDNSVT